MIHSDKSEEDPVSPSDQAHRVAPNWDPSPSKFRELHGEDQFSEASGVLFEQAMAQTRMAICLCDPQQDDLPIVFCNRAFRELTGYPEEEIIGYNCRFLQGPETDTKQVAKLRAAVASEEVVVVELLNYRKDGSSFWNALHLGPIYDQDGNLIYFFGSQWDVSDVRAARAEEIHAREMARELSHRMKNMFSVISGIVNITGRMRGAQDAAREINERVQALGRAYETTLDEASSGYIEIGQAIEAILKPYETSDDRVKLTGEELRVPFGVVSLVGLTLHELSANATKYGAWSNQHGQIQVDWRETQSEEKPRQFVLDWREAGGPLVFEPEPGIGSGHQIIDRLLRYGGGIIERNWRPEGLHVVVKFPISEVK